MKALWIALLATTLCGGALAQDKRKQDKPQQKQKKDVVVDKALEAKLRKKADADGDGKLSDKELKAFRKMLADHRGAAKKDGVGGKKSDLPAAVRKELRKKADVNGDGKLNDAERKAFRKMLADRRSGGKKAGDSPKKVGDGAKKVGDGAKKVGDGPKQSNVPAAVRKELRKKADVDGDGKLDDAERKAFRKMLADHRASKKGAKSDRKQR